MTTNRGPIRIVPASGSHAVSYESRQSGPSAVVDPFGRVVAHTEALTRDALVAEIAPTVDPSPYGRVGDLFGVTCAIVAAVALGLESRRYRAKL